ncbi:sulfatase-like hydrolase/transferase [Leptospira harrisiae]|uniref:Arylsulfatase n=1 Tax=Leptospira harrisiae TaxID=2023189 RepID=A0A2N0AK62_9LEPT|nr:sulfatase-like hydrolase/transferase [Leptospira harrisiae]PJZ84702.1 arylsulfatase [Leptospira harrisiae]PKA08122.1 arylsulfatase [Leptospira harrisiae]
MTFLYLFLYFLQGPILFSLGVWIYFHGLLLSTLTIITIMLDFYFNHNHTFHNLTNTSIRLFLWILFLIVLGYQEVYQTEVTFEIVFYFLSHISLLYADIFNFLYQWQLWQWFAFAIGFYFLFCHNHKRLKIILIVGLLFVVGLRYDSESKKNLIQTNENIFNPHTKIQNYLESIPGRPNLVLVLLEGVGRKHLLKTNSKYINFSVLQNSHFWIPMPHTSKSIFTWLTGEPQLTTTRITVNDSALHLNLPKQLQNSYGYQTFMIYTQSIYFEGMDLFFPKIFQSVWDKSYLEQRYGKLYPSFSWGMDDKVVLPALKQIVGSEKNPLFVLIGLSQTHSPYFVSKEDSRGQWNSPILRYQTSLDEEICVFDAIISFWKENSSRETVLILSADHGESFGEEGAHAHNYSLYNQETDVPFLLYFIKSGKVYVPNVGSSVDFKTTILKLLETHEGKTNIISENHFFQPNYQPNLFLKTWNSEIQKSWIFKVKKYIYHSDRDHLLQMDWSEKQRVIVTDPKLKRNIIEQMYSGMR